MSVNKVQSNGSLSPIATRGQTIQFSAMPTASADYLNRVVQYIGATTTDYTSGYFYRCELVSGSYTWVYVPASTGHTMYPEPDASLTETQLVSDINSRYNSPTNNEVPSVYDISRYSNEKKIRRVITGTTPIGSASIGTTGIGTWDNNTPPTETDWWYDDAFKIPDNRNDIDLSLKFDPSSGEPVTLGGYILDTTTGKLCIKFGNSIATPANAKIAVDITYTRNEFG